MPPSQKPHSPHPPLSTVIPPLSLGTATFNNQYNPSPHDLPTTHIIRHALHTGLTAFDTSPYYGPSEHLLGAALQHLQPRRESIFISTKCGRIAADEFDYSPAWLQQSVARSLDRLFGPAPGAGEKGPDGSGNAVVDHEARYIDLLLLHDIEFVPLANLIPAIATLRSLRSRGVVRYVGISGFPIAALCEAAEYILRETGEAVDAVMSYGNYTVQNTRLWSEGVERLRGNGGVEVVLNASLLGMGLLRETGVPVGSMGDWHPAERGLREKCKEAGERCRAVVKAEGWEGGEGGKEGKLERVALRWALENWREKGASVGTRVKFPGEKGVDGDGDSGSGSGSIGKLRGVNVCGVSYVEELEETLEIWNSVLRAEVGVPEDLEQRRKCEVLAGEVRDVLGEWVDYAWDSPGKDFVLKERKKVEDEGKGEKKE